MQGSRKAIGERRVSRRKEWFDEDCAEATREKNIPQYQLLTRNSRAKKKQYEDKR